ncbi:thermonuclease family protein [Mesorhizobium cantuariense]
MGKVQRHEGANQADRWRKRAGRPYRRRRLAGIPKRLPLLTLASMAAWISQWVMQHRDSIPDVGFTRWVSSSPGPIVGIASVIDGDTIEIHGQRIRFNGIDAPESKQYCDDAKGFEYPCGRRAAEALDSFLATAKPVQCTFVTWDRYGRFVSDCRRADGASVASWMVEHGQALDWPRYSHGAYAGQQAKAEAANSDSGPEGFRRLGNGVQGMPRRHLRPASRWGSSTGRWRKANRVSRVEHARKSVRATRQIGIWQTALGAENSTGTATAFLVRAYADKKRPKPLTSPNPGGLGNEDLVVVALCSLGFYSAHFGPERISADTCPGRRRSPPRLRHDYKRHGRRREFPGIFHER